MPFDLGHQKDWNPFLNCDNSHYRKNIANFHKNEGKISLEASELEITLNPKITQYNLKNKVYPKGRSTLGMPGTKTKKQQKKWKPKK